MKKTTKIIIITVVISIIMTTATALFFWGPGKPLPKPTFTVDFDSMGGNTIDSLTVEEGEIIESPVVYKEGYAFLGWYTSIDGGETLDVKWEFSKNSISKDLVLYASWMKILPAVYFNTNGGSMVKKIVLDEGELLEAPEDPTKEGYEFAGWYSDIELKNYYVFDVMPADNITLYADWGTGGLEYTLLEDNTYSVSRGSCDVSNVNIPRIYKGCPVTKIDDEAFLNYINLKNITIPENINSIGMSAFKGCSRLISLVLPEGIEEINESVFSGCRGLTNMVIPDKVISIGASAFKGCISLKNITILEAVKNIESSAFQDCESLLFIVLPETLTSIEEYTFSECESLIDIIIPETIMNIGEHAFSNCGSLKNITIPDAVINLENDVFSNCNNLVIHVKASSQPIDWHEEWNSDDRPVIWGSVKFGVTAEGYEYGVSLMILILV